MSERKFLYVWGVFILFALSAIVTSCDFQKSVGIQESMQSISDLTLIEGAESSSAIVSKSNESYFTLDIGNIEANNFVKSGEHKSWCIAWNKPIASNNSQHDGLKLYATYQDQNWKPINYLLNIRPSLQMQDPELTYREIQVAIWSLLDFPEFDLDKLSIDDIPSRMVTNGQYNFNREKVDQIVNIVQKNYKSFNYSSATTFAVVVETPSDTQTVIIEADETVWAYGQHSFRNQELRDQLGITGTGKGQWGWIFELDGDDDSTELIAGGGDDDGTKTANEVGTIVGSLEMARNGNELDVTYSLSSDYLISDLHLWVGCSLEEFPWVGNTGNVAPGGFPYHYSDEPTDTHTFSVDLSSYSCSGNIFLAAHAGELSTVEHIELPIDETPQFILTDLTEYGLNNAVDINDHGDIIGGNLYWENSTNSIITMPIYGNALNNNAEVVGRNSYWSIDTGVIEIGHFENIIIEPGSDAVSYSTTKMNTATDINNNGEVVGFDLFELNECLYDEFAGNDCIWITTQVMQPYIWSTKNGLKGVFSSETGNGDLLTNLEIGVQNNDQSFVILKKGGITAKTWDDINGSRDFEIEGYLIRLEALNNQNKIVGLASSYQTDELEIFIKKDDEEVKFTDFTAKSFPDLDINDHSQIAGTLRLNSGIPRETEAFYWDEDNGKIILPKLSDGNSAATSINNNGQIVGYSYDSNDRRVPVMWEISFETKKMTTSNPF